MGGDELTPVQRARILATAAHHGQLDKAGLPYIGHPARVAQQVAREGGGDQAVIVAWLHDVVEDTDVTLADVQIRFGLEIRDAVDAITHRRGERRELYYARVRHNPIARTVKLADIDDNTDPQRMALLDEATRARLLEKYAKARRALGAE